MPCIVLYWLLCFWSLGISMLINSCIISRKTAIFATFVCILYLTGSKCHESGTRLLKRRFLPSFADDLGCDPVCIHKTMYDLIFIQNLHPRNIWMEPAVAGQRRTESGAIHPQATAGWIYQAWPMHACEWCLWWMWSLATPFACAIMIMMLLGLSSVSSNQSIAVIQCCWCLFWTSISSCFQDSCNRCSHSLLFLDKSSDISCIGRAWADLTRCKSWEKRMTSQRLCSLQHRKLQTRTMTSLTGEKARNWSIV